MENRARTDAKGYPVAQESEEGCMKRKDPAKRRDRVSGKGSPYAKHHKAPYRYSGVYYEWKRQFVKEKSHEQS